MGCNGSGTAVPVLRRNRRTLINLMSDPSALLEMETDLTNLKLPINHNNFPAKLWCLVNSPNTHSIRWDPSGKTVIIDQPLFEAEFLSPVPKTSSASLEFFKTTNFTSFVRQLNIYGFRKLAVDADSLEKYCKPGSDFAQHRFHNPNFKQGHPELLANLIRLTSTNKAKIEAGLRVSCRPPSQTHRLMLNADEAKDTSIKGSVSKRQPSQRRVKAAPSPYHPSGSQQLKPCDRTPVPPRTWTMGPGNISSPTHFYTDKGVPLSMIYHMPMDLPYTVQPNSTIVQQGSQSAAAVEHKISPFFYHHPQYQPGFYTEVLPCSTPSPFQVSDMAVSHHPAAPYFHYGYYPNYTLGYFLPNYHYPDCLSGGSGDSRTSDVNLDTVFKIVDELQSLPKVHNVRVSSPDQRPSTSTAERSPAGFSQPKTVEASVIESFQKTAVVSMGDMSGQGERKRASHTTTSALRPHQKSSSSGKND